MHESSKRTQTFVTHKKHGLFFSKLPAEIHKLLNDRGHMRVQARVSPLHHLPTSFADLEFCRALAVDRIDPRNEPSHKRNNSLDHFIFFVKFF